MGKLIGLGKRAGRTADHVIFDEMVKDVTPDQLAEIKPIEEQEKKSYSNADMARMMGVSPEEFERMVESAGPNGGTDPFAGMNLNREQKRRMKVHKIDPTKK